MIRARPARSAAGGRRGASLAALAFGVAILSSGCAAGTSRGPLYAWGQYERILYEMWVKPGTADPYDASIRLEADIRRSEGSGRGVPPGVHAHLGWLYWLQGLTAEARAELEAERALFPESAVLVDEMLARLGRAEAPEGDAGVSEEASMPKPAPPARGSAR